MTSHTWWAHTYTRPTAHKHTRKLIHSVATAGCQPLFHHNSTWTTSPHDCPRPLLVSQLPATATQAQWQHSCGPRGQCKPATAMHQTAILGCCITMERTMNATSSQPTNRHNTPATYTRTDGTQARLLSFLGRSAVKTQHISTTWVAGAKQTGVFDLPAA